jgi:UDP-glucuronate 4-epimerase
MSRAVVTGAAGFIGSHLAERLLADGWDVLALDRFSDYYPRETKLTNAATFQNHPAATFVEADLVGADLDVFLQGADVVFHLAGQPGVRTSWADGFNAYLVDNVQATQLLLEAAVRQQVGRVVYSSSSSIYGDTPDYPSTERSLPQPISPYGVTKLAAEHLVRLYATNHGLSTVALRYFTVYGPRQRPDMATHRLVEAALRGTRFTLNGDGGQQRDFTFVDDVVAANVAAATADCAPGTVVNVAGGSSVTMTHLVELVEELAGEGIDLVRTGDQAGDVRRTGADTTTARGVLGWTPTTTLRDGVQAQVDWHRGRHMSVDESTGVGAGGRGRS